MNSQHFLLSSSYTLPTCVSFFIQSESSLQPCSPLFFISLSCNSWSGNILQLSVGWRQRQKPFPLSRKRTFYLSFVFSLGEFVFKCLSTNNKTIYHEVFSSLWYLLFLPAQHELVHHFWFKCPVKVSINHFVISILMKCCVYCLSEVGNLNFSLPCIVTPSRPYFGCSPWNVTVVVNK